MIELVARERELFDFLLKHSYYKIIEEKSSMCLELISKIRLVFRARRETVKKRSIHVVCEHFEPFRNAAMGT
jgi:hypothetical protein